MDSYFNPLVFCYILKIKWKLAINQQKITLFLYQRLPMTRFGKKGGPLGILSASSMGNSSINGQVWQAVKLPEALPHLKCVSQAVHMWLWTWMSKDIQGKFGIWLTWLAAWTLSSLGIPSNSNPPHVGPWKRDRWNIQPWIPGGI